MSRIGMTGLILLVLLARGTSLRADEHWAYVGPHRTEPPAVRDSDWVRNDIDEFILSWLEHEGLAPSPEAERTTLLRRLSLDLIGLPPSPAEVEAFLRDESDVAYEKAVDRLLARPQFGERWARPWLDLARYADSHGFQRDDLRDVWAYRDWVIEALNADMPFDQFTIEQLAGDLLPEATESQRIATGFHRCAPTNVEAGSIPEETRTNQVLDRVSTTATVWLGSTLECAQCHDHKYDAFTQREYYQFFAFFNNTEIEADRSNPKAPASIRFLGPTMPLSHPEQDTRRGDLRSELAQAKKRQGDRRKELSADLEEWAESLAGERTGGSQSHVLPIAEFVSQEGAGSIVLEDGSVLLTDDPPERDTYVITAQTDLVDVRAFRLEVLTDPSLPGSGPGRGDEQRPNFVLNTFSVTAERGGATEPVRLLKATADFSQKNYAVTGAIDSDPKTAWAIAPEFHKPHWAVFETAGPVGDARGTTLRFTLVQNFGAARTIGRLRLLAITGDPDLQEMPQEIIKRLERPAGEWSDDDRERLVEYRLKTDEAAQRLTRRIGKLEQQIAKLAPETTLVMRERQEPRTTHIFMRGDYRNVGEEVTPGTPAVLHPFPDGPRNRLTLARWLVDRRNPLTARVVVNRWWAELFGQGLVRTPEDFGVQGERPTHPELLDWLAVELMESGWSMKHVLRTIVTSATYRQSSHVTPELLARDDQNKLYARGPRFRMDAEMIRDNALAIAGLVSLRQGGPPIRPPQPEGLWTKVGGQKYDYTVSPGAERYRRGIYVVWKRGSPYPSFVNFDATARLACTVQRSRTNTPLQALTLLNDPVYVEAAVALARRIVVERPETDFESRLHYAFRLCTARIPDETETRILRRLYERQFDAAQGDDRSRERAAWQAVATALLNLDETITKE